MKGKKGLKRIGGTFAALCILLLASTIQSCDESVTSITPAPAAAAQGTSQAHENPIAGKMMILDRAYNAQTKTTYKFDANNPEDQYLLVPSKAEKGHMIQTLEQKEKTAGREFTEQFYQGSPTFDANLTDQGEYVVSDNKGNMLWYREWKGAPLFTESEIENGKGATLAAPRCYQVLVCVVSYEASGYVHYDCYIVFVCE